jgi:hypothetical protein
MKTSLRTLSIVALGVASLAIARPASAGYQTETVTATFGTPTQLQTYFSTNSTAFALFNPNLGTLESVSISLSSTSTVASGVVNTSMVSSSNFTVSAIDQVTVTGLNGTTQAMASLASNQVSGTINPNSTLSGLGAVTGTTTSGPVNQPDLSDYIGTGTAMFSASGKTTVTGVVTGGPVNPNVGFVGSTLFSGSIIVTYSFSPSTSVPEPASVVMLVIGLGGAAVAARFRRSGK